MLVPKHKNTFIKITTTVYDQPYEPLIIPNAPMTQKNLRNRVSYTSFKNLATSATYYAGTFYTYDVHGNVDTLLQDYAGIPGMVNSNNRFKLMAYDYDLISGKVNSVHYQPKAEEAFYHRYFYDAENRLTNVETSRDKIVWERDAAYSYYKHGPLARMVLGQNQVQGVDYAYTTQGWVKGINSTTVSDGTWDIGSDGMNAASTVARDVFGFALHYYHYDYKTIDAAVKPFASSVAPIGFVSLFNGNIAGMSVNVPKVGQALRYTYRYDQLNRLTSMLTYRGLVPEVNEWAVGLLSDYRENISYDPNGNILTYRRNGSAAQLNMDNMTYQYPKDANGNALNNRLRYVHDEVAENNYGDDIDSQTPLTLAQVQAEKLPEQATDNYSYDAIGNLIRDTKGGITNIKWNVYGKISIISKNFNVVGYGYDAAGNRIFKVVTTLPSGNQQTLYVRDAAGNVMSVYSMDPDINQGNFTQTETYLYGSSRIGIAGPLMVAPQTINVAQGYGSGKIYTFTRNEKNYQLTNHLENVMAVVGDKKLQVDVNADGVVDYYPFGKLQPGRQFGNVGRYTFNGKEYDKEVKIQDYGKRMYSPDLGRFISVDPITASYPMLTPFQFASNRPIDGIDLDGLEYLAFHKSMYRLGYITENATTKNGVGKIITLTNSKTVINTIYENIPAALQNPKTQSFKFVAGGPVTQIGRDYASAELAGILYEKEKYFVTGKFYGTADGDHDPEPTVSTSGMGGAAINQGRSDAANAAIGALGEEGIGLVANQVNKETRDALGIESDLRRGFYNATNAVDHFITNVKGWKEVIPDETARINMINFITDGYLPTAETDKFTGSEFSVLRRAAYEKQLNTAWYGTQMIQQLKKGGFQISIQKETKVAIKEIINKYKSDGGDSSYDELNKLCLNIGD